MRAITRLRSRLLEYRFQWTDKYWQEGYSTATAEADEVVEDKDAFIAEQAAIIVRLMEVIDFGLMWSQVPEDLREKLRSYV